MAAYLLKEFVLPSQGGSMKHGWWLAAAGLFLAIVLLLLFRVYWNIPEDRTYRIGFENDPPLHFPDQNGRPTGLAVEVVSEAAQRAGIRLQWIYENRGPEAGLRSGAIDLWPLMTIRPERKGIFHVTEPYRENESFLLVPADGAYQKLEDLDGRSICLDGGPLAQRFLKDKAPHLRLQIVDTPNDAIQCLCRNEAEAAYLDAFSTISSILDGAACSGKRLRILRVPGSRSQLGIGATFAAANAADAIRREIDRMAGQGRLSDLVGRWSDMTGRNMELNATLAQTQRKVSYLYGTVTIILLLMGFTGWMALRLRYQKNCMVHAEEARRKSEKQYAGLFDNMTLGVALHRMVYDPHGLAVNYEILDVNPSFETTMCLKNGEVLHRLATDVYGTEEPPYLQEYVRSIATGKPYHFETYFSPRKKHLDLSVVPIERDRFAVIFSDITYRKQAEEEKAKLESQLQQAQRMESIGRLAGGVAHDFNNLLTVINGYSDLLLSDGECTEAQQQPLRQIHGAGKQAASLTQQLLAFSRRQVIQPKAILLNRMIEETREMLGRLVGEDIELNTRLDPDLALTMADPSQIQQVLMNLVVNARDAMPKGGRIVLETANVFFDSEYAAMNPEARSGHCVLLSVSDTGMGIAKENLRHIFEPFFTTKSPGEGTGLGLSMVYGIIRQNHGWIWPYSEPGQGTTFKIYLPQVPDGVSQKETPSAQASITAGTETILLVEDQENVRLLARTVLQKCGYRILEAAHGSEALEKSKCHPDPIHLLLTDVVLPGLTGKDLADRLLEQRPKLKVLFTSGYTENIIAHHGVLQSGLHYLEKPYTPLTLATKVREVLDWQDTAME